MGESRDTRPAQAGRVVARVVCFGKSIALGNELEEHKAWELYLAVSRCE